MHRPRHAGHWPVLLLAAILTLTGCGSDEGLPPLRADPMATLPVPGTLPGPTTEDGAGSALGKPVFADVRRRLPLRASADPAEVLDAAQRLAEDAGWTFLPASSAFPTVRVADRTRDGQDLDLSLTLLDLDTEPVLLVRLRNASSA